MASDVSTKLTYDDYCLFPDDGLGHEIIDGEHYEHRSPNTKHQLVLGNICFPLWGYVRDNRLGQVFHARYDVVLSDVDIVQPDVIFINNERRHLINEANFRGVPDLVVEILSPSKRDYDEVVKFKRYGALGVDEYWIVDPERDVVSIYRRTASGLALVPSFDPITTPLIPGFSLPVRDIFAYPV